MGEGKPIGVMEGGTWYEMRPGMQRQPREKLMTEAKAQRKARNAIVNTWRNHIDEYQLYRERIYLTPEGKVDLFHRLNREGKEQTYPPYLPTQYSWAGNREGILQMLRQSSNEHSDLDVNVNLDGDLGWIDYTVKIKPRDQRAKR